jgi:geranyl-CoA carboxylase alpha subunit
MAKITKILIANRGEIALRVMRTARSLGIKTVAVYSDADAAAPHTIAADEAVCIGAAPVGQSYLRGDAIIAAAQHCGADAIHPGYGFLSENADFAAAVEEAGITFIGPTAEAIDLMGNKAAAKRLMIEAGVPCVPGYEEKDQTEARLLAAGSDIGFPLMVKAAAGGGGRGMRLVHAEQDLKGALESARSEAENAFGSGELILEKAIIKPRHVEIQVFADNFGHTVHFGERDCSVQRRHQKVIEESPCPVMTPELRAQMGQAAVDAAKSINYRGAGTVEFLLDAEGEFYFLEMNTRLQVEHPVTEAVTGVDLVALQIQVAEGLPLGLSQDDIQLEGAAIEIRLYAEDPANGFLPATGRVELWQPAAIDGVRYDAGIVSGQAISPFYDPMMAKIIAYGSSREIARQRLLAALRATPLFGLPNNRDFLIACLERDAFIAGQATTAFIAENFSEQDFAVPPVSAHEQVMLGVAHFVQAQIRHQAQAIAVGDHYLNFSTLGGTRSLLKFRQGEEPCAAEIRVSNAGAVHVLIDDQGFDVRVLKRTASHLSCVINGHTHAMDMLALGQLLHCSIDGRQIVSENVTGRSAADDTTAGSGRVTAPMHGSVIKVSVAKGEQVSIGQQICVVEAMKMQHEITAEIDGIVEDVFVTNGQQVAAGDMLAEIVEGSE